MNDKGLKKINGSQSEISGKQKGKL